MQNSPLKSSRFIEFSEFFSSFFFWNAVALWYPGCQRLFMRGFRFRSSLKKCQPAAEETKLPDPREKKPLVPRVALWRLMVCFQQPRTIFHQKFI